MTTVNIPLSKTGKYAGKFTAIVDEIDSGLGDLNWSVLSTKNTRYAYRTIKKNGKQTKVLLHREIMKRILGHDIPDGYEVDHKNGKGLDCRRDNLRLATKKQNQYNRGKNRRNTSGYKGVGWDKRYKKWAARIVVSGKTKHIGYYDSPELAHAAYCEKAKELHGEFSNFGDNQ